MLKKIVHCLIVSLFVQLSINKLCAQVAIAPYLFGQNAWMTDTIGSSTDTIHVYSGSGSLKLRDNWQKVEDSRCKSVRIGGKGFDRYRPSDLQWIKLIDSIRNNGSEPIVEVGYWDGKWTAAQAKVRVQKINGAGAGEYNRNVRYWIIANEPNVYNTNNTDALIASYVKDFAAKMKEADSTIKIIAPELTHYKTSLMTPLTDPVGANDITGKVPGHMYAYVDYISFHTYPFDDTATSRSNVISKLRGSSGLKINLDTLNARINRANTAHSRTSIPLKIAITEANITTLNNTSDTTLTGISAYSYIAGQFWAEMMGIAMEDSVQFLNFWSIMEGNTASTDKGYLYHVNANKRSTYWHFKIVAANFIAGSKYFKNVSTASGQPNYKAFACSTATELRVLIMNQSQQSDPRGFDNTTESFVANFNGVTPGVGPAMRFAFATGNTTTHAGGLTSGVYSCNIQKETSMFLAFDKSTGELLRNEVYSLQDALRPNDVGMNSWVTGSPTITTQGVYDAYNSAEVHANITISPATTITADTGSNKVFQFTNGATINGPFSSGPIGTTLSITPTVETGCH